MQPAVDQEHGARLAALRAVVRRWTTERDPAGHRFEAGRYGYYRAAPHPVVSLRAQLSEPAAAVAEARARFAGRAVTLWLEAGARERHLRPGLVAAGAVPDFEAVYLGYAGELPETPAVPGLAVRPGGADQLEALVVTKRKAFMATEWAPREDLMREELRRRQADFAGNGRFFLAWLDDEPVGLISWFRDGRDYFINLLGTRVPYRGRGIARNLVREMLRTALAEGAQSILVVPEPAVARIYAGLGFCLAVESRRSYRLGPAP